MGTEAPVRNPVPSSAAQRGRAAAETSEASATPAVAGRDLTTTTARGFMWATGGTLVAKVVAMVGQIALAAILSKEDFGAVALALAIAAFPSVLQSGGIAAVLTHRQAKYRLYVNACFWLSVMLGLVAGLLILAAAAGLWQMARFDWAPEFAKSSVLPGLLGLAALNCVLSGAGVVAHTTLQVQLRFKLVAALSALVTIMQMCAAVPLAMIGFGPYSVLLATTLGTTFALIIAWWKAHPPIRLDTMHRRRWRYLIRDGSHVLLTNLVWCLSMQGDKLILGKTLGKASVGVYFFANNLSFQTAALLTQNMTTVLFPTFSKLTGDPERQIAAFMRAIRLLAMIGVPLTLAQAACAEPGLRILFGEKWLDAVRPIQWFSVGMAAFVASGVVTSLIQAQGRFHLLLYLSIGFAVLLLPGIWYWSLQAGVEGAAAWMATLQWTFAIAGLGMGLWGRTKLFRSIASVYAFPLVASLVALVPGVILGKCVISILPLASGTMALWVPEGLRSSVEATLRWSSLGRNWLQIGFIAALAAMIYPLLAYLCNRELFMQLWDLVIRVAKLDRLFKRRAAAG